MAQPTVYNDNIKYSAIAASDMAGKAYRFAKWQASSAPAQDALGYTTCGIGDEPDGIAQEGPAAGQVGPVDTVGRLKIETGAAVSAFDELGPDANGKAITVPAGTGYAKALLASTGDTLVIDCIWLGRRRGGGEGGFDVQITNGMTLSSYSRYHLLTAGSAGADASTLPDGRYIGQRKTLQATVVGTGTMVVTGKFVTNVTNTTAATFNAVGDQLELVWNGTRWFVLINVSVTLA